MLLLSAGRPRAEEGEGALRQQEEGAYGEAGPDGKRPRIASDGGRGGRGGRGGGGGGWRNRSFSHYCVLLETVFYLLTKY